MQQMTIHQNVTGTAPLLVALHPKEEQLIQLIRSLGYGTIERLIIQNGLPHVAETVKQHHKFG
jgi:hypothetical protein